MLFISGGKFFLKNNIEESFLKMERKFFPETPTHIARKYIIKSQRGSLESEHKNLYSSKYIASATAATFSLVTTMLLGIRRNDKKNIFTLSLCAFARTHFPFMLLPESFVN